MANYRPQLYIRTADVNVSLQWPEGTPDAAEKMVCMASWLIKLCWRSHQIMPGDNVELICELVHDIAAETGTR